MTQPDAGTPATARVVLAFPMEIDGVHYDADTEVEVPLNHGNGPFTAPNAVQLVNDGRARWPLAEPKPAAAEPPPRSGAGSGRDAWAAYAADRQVPVTDDMTRDDIAAAVDAATPKES